MDDGMSAMVSLPDAPARLAILVVEDEALIRFATADLLRHDGHLVLEAATADEALALLAAGVRIDAIFSDVQMPGRLDGIDLARRVAEAHPQIAVVLTSANSPDHRLSAGNRFVRKPYRDADVVAALRAALGEDAFSQDGERPDDDAQGDGQGGCWGAGGGGAGGGRRGARP